MAWKRDAADTPVAESPQIRGNQVFPVRLSGHENKKHSFREHSLLIPLVPCWSLNFPFLLEKGCKAVTHQQSWQPEQLLLLGKLETLGKETILIFYLS